MGGGWRREAQISEEGAGEGKGVDLKRGRWRRGGGNGGSRIIMYASEGTRA